MAIEKQADITRDRTDVRALLKRVLNLEASDLHVTVDSPPMVRVHGDLERLPIQRLSEARVEALVRSVLSQRQWDTLQDKASVDLAYTYDASARFRINVFYQRGRLSIVFRRLASLQLSLDALGLPETLYDLSGLRDGLVLVTGPTGSGKTTTLATLIDMINQQKSCHIITIEDPIEFEHENIQSLVTQREVYSDVHSFSGALRDALREDPDVILVGEMRDLDTMRTAIMAAETGHLVFSTLHSRDAVSSLHRMISVFPFEEQAQIRIQLAGTLKAVISQRLLKRADTLGRIPAVEVMKVNTAISNLIRIQKLEQIYSLLETGRREGMQTMEHSLAALCRDGLIDRETALKTAKSESVILCRLEREDA
jgi:twitching motility protein PilT